MSLLRRGATHGPDGNALCALERKLLCKEHQGRGRAGARRSRGGPLCQGGTRLSSCGLFWWFLGVLAVLRRPGRQPMRAACARYCTRGKPRCSGVAYCSSTVWGAYGASSDCWRASKRGFLGSLSAGWGSCLAVLSVADVRQFWTLRAARQSFTLITSAAALCLDGDGE